MTKFNLNTLSKDQKNIRRKILEVSHKLHFSHLGSCLSTVDLIDAIYQVKSKEEKFILSNGHAGIALYVILEKNGFLKSNEIEKLHVHPDRNASLGIDVSSGSLGQGLPIAIGIALSDREKTIYCIISDGECAEGSIWESLRILHDLKINNLKILINVNGWGCYGTIDQNYLYKRLKGFELDIKKINGHHMESIIEVLKAKNNRPSVIFAITRIDQLPFLKDQDAHYHIMKEEDFVLAMKLLQ